MCIAVLCTKENMDFMSDALYVNYNENIVALVLHYHDILTMTHDKDFCFSVLNAFRAINCLLKKNPFVSSNKMHHEK